MDFFVLDNQEPFDAAVYRDPGYQRLAAVRRIPRATKLGVKSQCFAIQIWSRTAASRPPSRNPTSSTAGNFARAVPFAAVVSITSIPWAHLDPAGVGYAIISGVITSVLGYVVWYSAQPGLKAASAAIVQLSVPLLTAGGGILSLGELISLRYVLASIAVLGGIALFAVTPHPREQISNA